LSIGQISIGLIRDDGKRGVSFDSPETLQFFLDYIRAIGDPSTQYYIPVLENNGIIPSVDPSENDYDADFDALLTRMGVMPYDIPNTMRGYFMVAFQGGANMEMTWWGTTPSDRQRDFVSYLTKASQINDLPPAMVEDQKRLRELIIPTLEQGDGWIPEDLDNVRNLAQRWDMTNHQLAAEIRRLWERMTEQLSAAKAGRIVDRSASTMCRWARDKVIYAGVNAKGHWYFTREVLIDRFE